MLLFLRCYRIGLGGTVLALQLDMVTRNTMDPAEGIGIAQAGPDRADAVRPIRVWLVDDSENFRTLLAALLDDEGGLRCERQFPTAEAVLEALAEGTSPDVILLDVRMPGMGGVAAVRPIRKLAGTTRILMLTTFGDAALRAQSLSDGASDFLLKSFEIQEIAERVRTAHAAPLVSAAPLRETVLEEWPNRRALEADRRRTECVQNNLSPESGRRSGAGGGECHSNRLVRGVQFLRGLLSQAIGRGIARKRIQQFAPVAHVE